MTLAELHHQRLRRALGQYLTAADYGVLLMRDLIKQPLATYKEIFASGNASGMLWAQRHHLIVFHRGLWQVSKLGREYLDLLENPRFTRSDVNAFLERARSEVKA